MFSNIMALTIIILAIVTNYNYMSIDNFNTILIVINSMMLIKFYGMIDIFNTVSRVNLLKTVTLKTYELVYQLHLLDGSRTYRNLIVVPLMLFFAYIGYTFNTVLWMFYLLIDELTRHRTENILLTKNIFIPKVEENEE